MGTLNQVAPREKTMAAPVSKSTTDPHDTYDDKVSTPPAAEQHSTEDGVEPSGYRGDNPATGGPGRVGLQNEKSDEREGLWNPSSPEDGNITPGSKQEGQEQEID